MGVNFRSRWVVPKKKNTQQQGETPGGKRDTTGGEIRQGGNGMKKKDNDRTQKGNGMRKEDNEREIRGLQQERRGREHEKSGAPT